MEEQVNSSDSDSSETWSVIDKNEIPPDYGTLEYDLNNSDTAKNQEKIHNEDDTDTDGGIAVISDEETDVTTTTPDIPYTRESGLNNGDRRNIQLFFSSGIGEISDMIKNDDQIERLSTSTVRESEQELSEEFFLSDYKSKSYIHRKNDKISSLLNGVLLSSVMFTIILAIGYLWGTSDDCSLSTIKSVSQILADMQKLQLENEMLKSKVAHLQYLQNLRASEDSVVFLDHENAFKNIEKRGRIDLNKLRKKESEDCDSATFDSKFGIKYPRIGSFNINHSLFSNFENKTSPETLEIHKAVPTSKISQNNRSKIGKYSTVFKKGHRKSDCLQNLMNVDDSLFGPKTYCESVLKGKSRKINKQKKSSNLYSADVKMPREKESKETGSHVNSDGTHLEKKQKYVRKNNKLLKKLDKKQPKVYESSKDFLVRGNKSEKNKRKHLNINSVDPDWYQKMLNAREEFRKWHQYANEINHQKSKDKSNWYLRRMRDRESIRFNSDV